MGTVTLSSDLVLVDTDCDTGRLYESWSGGHPVPRATWDEYQRRLQDLDELAHRLTSGEYVPGWKFRSALIASRFRSLTTAPRG